ncbi:MAG: cupin domain-containing protein [Deltaproteobacteria bacterium]|nr:MAG: cupin domain-containing protein [Deltaproteobacteria bacterium]
MVQHRTIAIVLAATACGCGMRAWMHPGAPTRGQASEQPAFLRHRDLTWTRIVPELGATSPEIAIMHVDPATQATQLMIRTPAAIHVRKHWHSANETHTIIRGTAVLECDGQRAELGPGSFNFMPAKMIHEAWLPAHSLTFITVDRAWDINWVEGAPTAADVGARPPRLRHAAGAPSGPRNPVEHHPQ